MIIQTILLDPSGAVWNDEAANVSRLDPSEADQTDAEHPSRNRKVVGSNPTSGSKTAGQRAFLALLTVQRQRAVIPLVGSARRRRLPRFATRCAARLPAGPGLGLCMTELRLATWVRHPCRSRSVENPHDRCCPCCCPVLLSCPVYTLLTVALRSPICLLRRVVAPGWLEAFEAPLRSATATWATRPGSRLEGCGW
jgi:hypothetical protein